MGTVLVKKETRTVAMYVLRVEETGVKYVTEKGLVEKVFTSAKTGGKV